MVRSLDFIESAQESHWRVLVRGVMVSDLDFKKSFLATIGIMERRGLDFE